MNLAKVWVPGYCETSHYNPSNLLQTNDGLHFGKPCVNETVAVGIVMHRHMLGTQPCRNQIYSRVLFLRQTRHCPQLPLVHVHSTKHPSLLTARTETLTQYLLALNSEMLFQRLQEMLCGISMDFECTCYSDMQIQNAESRTLTEKCRYLNDDALSHRTQWIKYLKNGCTVERKTAVEL